jgi:pimeloyl-ACP methyl ester carboxylesterase
MKSIFNSKHVLSLSIALLAGCTSLPNKISEKVGDRRLEYVLVQHDTPAVVFENGWGGTVDSWAKVFPEVAKDTTAFAYNRPGYGPPPFLSS